MGNNQQLFAAIVGVVLLFAVVAAAIGAVSYQAGQQAAIEAALAQQPTPEITPAPVEPPAIVTNTPTSTPAPLPTNSATPTPTSSPTQTPTPTPTPIVVINEIKELGRLETTEYAMKTIIDLSNEPDNLWEQIVGSDQLMLVAEGEVVAGFELDKILEDDITVEGTSVRIVLPAPEILYSRIDNKRTQVYERRTGLFVPPDISLEGRARQLAEEALTEWATERGIHDRAKSAGVTRIENLLRSLGFTDITIVVKEKEL
jgi:GNAT superfamily N-acetyltransferase